MTAVEVLLLPIRVASTFVHRYVLALTTHLPLLLPLELLLLLVLGLLRILVARPCSSARPFLLDDGLTHAGTRGGDPSRRHAGAVLRGWGLWHGSGSSSSGGSSVGGRPRRQGRPQ